MEVDLGIIFKNDCFKFIQGHLFPEVKLSKDEKVTVVEEVKNRCWKFLLVVLDQIENCLTSN